MAKSSSVLPRPKRLVTMTSEDIRNRQWTEEEKSAVRRLAAKQEAGDDSEIGYSDIPKLTPEQLSQFVRFRDRPRKVAVSVRLDAKVVEWLKAKGEGHLTRINDILLNLEDRFGRRPRPVLRLALEDKGVRAGVLDSNLYRFFGLALENHGRGISKSPALRMRKPTPLTVPPLSVTPNLPLLDGPDGIRFRGGSNDVIYPGEIRQIGELMQRGQRKLILVTGPRGYTTEALCFDDFQSHYEVFCDGMRTVEGTITINELQNL